MVDREKVINGLESCVISMTKCFFNRNEMCPYASVDVCHCEQELMSDALALLKEQEDLGTELTNAVELIHKKNERIEKLLKEQEAVKVEKRKEEEEWNVCSNCGCHLIHKWSYCPCCGRSVKWE